MEIEMKKKKTSTKEESKDLGKDSFQKVNNVGELKKWLRHIDNDTPVMISSDEEGNTIQKVEYLQLYDDGMVFYPWEERGTGPGVPLPTILPNEEEAKKLLAEMEKLKNKA